MKKPSLFESISVIHKAWDHAVRAEQVHCEVGQLNGSVYRKTSSITALVERCERDLTRLDPHC
jgi:hypothetical protein